MTAHRVGIAAGLVFEYQLLPIVSGPMLPAIQRHYHVRFLYPGFRDVLKAVEGWLRRGFAHLRLQLHCELRRVTSIPVLSSDLRCQGFILGAISNIYISKKLGFGKVSHIPLLLWAARLPFITQGYTLRCIASTCIPG